MTEATLIEPGGRWWAAGGGHLWADDGRTTLPAAETLAQAEASVARYEAGEFYCAGHKAWHPKPEAFRRFAGLYCEEAAEAYKAANTRLCLLCRQPIWNCYC
jgi:hypothetical protein